MFWCDMSSSVSDDDTEKSSHIASTQRGARGNEGRGAARGALITEPPVIHHVNVQLAEFGPLRIFPIHVLPSRVPVQPTPFCYVTSSEEVREVKRQGIQNLFHAGPDLWSDQAPEPH